MKKFVFILVVCGLSCCSIVAQPQRMMKVANTQNTNGDSDTIWPKQITGSDIYFEYFVQGKDTVLRFTGKGGIWDKYCPQFNKYKATVTRIEIGEGITSVGGFASCPRLKMVILPVGVKEIRKEAFRYDSSMQQINFPEGIEKIFTNAFEKVGLPDTLRLPTSLCYMEGGSFRRALHYTFLEVPMKIDSLNGATFGYSTSLSTVVLPANIGFMAMNAFSEDTMLRQIYNLSFAS